MKTIVILSDTHRNLAAIDKLAGILRESDYIVHLGDMASDMREVMKAYPDKTYVLSGNNDFFGPMKEAVIEVEGRRIFACHGHLHGVKSGTERLLSAVKERGCDIGLYGHTHMAQVEEKDGILLINPGSMTRFGTENTYCYLVIVGKKAVATIVKI